MDKQTNTGNSQQTDQASNELAQNENPRANENIRVRTDEPLPRSGKTDEVGSEITDGEDA